MSVTHVLLIEGYEQPQANMRPVIGYVTLSNSVLLLTEASDSLRKLTKLPELPAILLGKMAVDHRHQGKKLGEFLLKYALKCCWEISKASGCHVVLVDAKNEGVKNFYLKYGFDALPDRPLRLFLPIRTVGKLLSN